MPTSLQHQKRPHAELLEMAIRWERVRFAWFTNSGQSSRAEDCLRRERRLEATLDQARRDAAPAAEGLPAV